MKKIFFCLLISCSGIALLSSCGKDDSVKGCTDINSSNYNPDATEDDGSCLYDSVVTINIISPDESIKESEDSILSIKVKYSSIGYIHNISINLIQLDIDSLVYSSGNLRIEANKMYTYEDSYVLRNNDHTNFLFTASVWKDSLNIKSDTVIFHSHPH